MKKFIIILLLSCFAFYSKAQVDSLVIENVNVTEAERIIDKYSDKIYDGVSTIAEKLTEPAQEVFGYVVFLQIAKGIGMLLPIPLVFIFSFLFLMFYKKVEWSYNSPTAETTGVFTLSIVFGVMAGVSIIIAFCTTYTGLLHLLAPEWYAIKEIVGLIQ